jgi:hypothetical protein
MTDPDPGGPKPPPSTEGPREPIPLGQRLLDSPFLLLIAGMVVMFVFFTGWGLYEIASLAKAPLP